MQLAVGGRAITVLILCLCSALTLVSPAAAGDFTGYSDTGFVHTNKAECCEEAVFMARNNAAAACEDAGGYAIIRQNSARGRCSARSHRDERGRSRFRCTATATVACR